MLGDALCASGERIESREGSTDDAVDDAYYFEQAIEKQHGIDLTLALTDRSLFKNLPFVVSSQRYQLPPIPFSSSTAVVVSMEMCVQNLYPRCSPELPGNSRKALVELRATKERLRCESFPISPFLLPDVRLTPSSDKNLTLGRGTFAFDARVLSGFNVKSLRATTSELAEASRDAVTRAG
ncbi:hypothetical protein ALC60_14550 [Trachymyrmex zeteki]|uniref:Uncharacterized protein n=1 Tax=Mycetomoellerius zeteki TaxID=64791 RepID=A0A151WF28_9HYME|nr:hypothetical protein ALC60_14550 [Trachymyrmex zeteki]